MDTQRVVDSVHEVRATPKISNDVIITNKDSDSSVKHNEVPFDFAISINDCLCDYSRNDFFYDYAYDATSTSTYAYEYTYTYPDPTDVPISSST